MKNSSPLISIVSPVYRAENCISELCSRLRNAITPITKDFEIILVEDRSPDNSWTVIQEESNKDTRIIGIRLAKNFGQHRAITAGLDIAKGEWVVVMDCDLEDLPEDIPLLYGKANEGYEIVLAKFEERYVSNFRQKISQSFWRLLSWLSGIPFDHRIGNFRIMSRRVVENFRRYREQMRLLGGITTLMGFTTTTVSVKRGQRYAGESSYTLKKLISVAFDIVMAYSDKPLKLSVFAGLIMSGLAMLAGISVFILSLRGFIEVSGWASVMISLYLIGGLVIANLGVLGYYIGRTFEETKRRPLYIIEESTIDYQNNNVEQNNSLEGKVVWITGLSGAGKSTLAAELVDLMRVEGEAVVLLDGDELREVLGATVANKQNHDRDRRLALAMQYAQLCRVIAAQGFTVVIATISLFREVHAWNRANLPGYFEVYLKVPLEELRRRDPKGIYSRFDSGELNNVAGLDIEIDEPNAADLVVAFEAQKSVVKLAEDIKQILKRDKKI